MLVGAVQLTSKNNKKKNLSVAVALMKRAVQQGAELIALPEYFSFIGTKQELLSLGAENQDSGLAYKTLKEFAKKNKVYILGGTIPTFGPDKKRLYNRSVLIGPKGETLAQYDKIHLFDTELIDARSYRESDTFLPGKKLVLADTPFGKVGLTVCYDLRFPEVYRNLALRGARLIFVPAAFTMYTGKDHWLALLRARAIENQAYIIAPAQYGKNSEHKISFGKTCIIDPWGNIVAQAADCETVIIADIDFKFLSKVRRELPVLKHYRKDVFELF
ncbi:MAG: carbon-nitrogen hydrolase family protein [Bacteriovoracia bacterium]